MKKSILSLLSLAAATTPAFAHTGHELGGFAAGFMHPLLGADHVAVMLAVGLWAGLTCGRRAWLPLLAFPSFMAVGAGFSGFGLEIPNVELGIAGTVLAMGLLLAGLIRLPAVTASLLVGLFAILHGAAHGVEMPSAAEPWAYGVGFVAATALLHGVGLLTAVMLNGRRSLNLARGTGALLGLFGVWLAWVG